MWITVYCISALVCTSPWPGHLQPPRAWLNGNYFAGCRQQRHAFHLHLERDRTQQSWFPLVSCPLFVPITASMQPGGFGATSRAGPQGDPGKLTEVTAGERWSNGCCVRERDRYMQVLRWPPYKATSDMLPRQPQYFKKWLASKLALKFMMQLSVPLQMSY